VEDLWRALSGHICVLFLRRYTVMWFLRSLMSFALVHLQAWKTSGGHILVKPLVDGQEVGFMILDTGALLCGSETIISTSER